ncbi:MAG: hypothetical protein ACUZ9M_00635 [Candidatus Scalindua sp.]
MLHEIIELKPGWAIRKPYWMTDFDMYKYRFDPITIGLIVASSFKAISTIQEGRAARAEGEAQAEIANRNALLAERQAEAEQQAAVAEAKRQEREGEALKGRQRAAIAKSGIVGGRGTPLTVLVETAETLEAERLTILREGAIGASQRRQQAGISRAQGAAAKARGKAASRASGLAAAGAILTSVGTVGQSRFERGLKPFSRGRRV